MILPSINIKDIIESNANYVFADDLFIGREPSSPSNSITIFDTANRGRVLYAEKDDPYEYGGVQIRVRNNRYDIAMEIARELVDILHGLGNMTQGTTYITAIRALDNPFLLDWDENNRARIITNYNIQQTS
jgi:hypothetical protein